MLKVGDKKKMSEKEVRKSNNELMEQIKNRQEEGSYFNLTRPIIMTDAID